MKVCTHQWGPPGPRQEEVIAVTSWPGAQTKCLRGARKSSLRYWYAYYVCTHDSLLLFSPEWYSLFEDKILMKFILPKLDIETRIVNG